MAGPSLAAVLDRLRAMRRDGESYSDFLGLSRLNIGAEVCAAIVDAAVLHPTI
jgi:hypothetical protein